MLLQVLLYVSKVTAVVLLFLLMCQCVYLDVSKCSHTDLGCVFLSVVVIISFTHLVQEGSGCLMDYSPYSLMICIFFFISKCLRLSEAGYMRL